MAESNRLPSANWVLAITSLAPRFWFVLAFVGSIVLWMPTALAASFGINSLREIYRSEIGLTTLISSAFWAVSIVPVFQRWNYIRQRRAEILKRLPALSLEEWHIFFYCLANNQQSILLDFLNPIQMAAAYALKQKQLLTQAGCSIPGVWPHTIPDFVWEHLKTIDFRDKTTVYGQIWKKLSP